MKAFEFGSWLIGMSCAAAAARCNHAAASWRHGTPEERELLRCFPRKSFCEFLRRLSASSRAKAKGTLAVDSFPRKIGVSLDSRWLTFPYRAAEGEHRECLPNDVRFQKD